MKFETYNKLKMEKVSIEDIFYNKESHAIISSEIKKQLALYTPEQALIKFFNATTELDMALAMEELNIDKSFIRKNVLAYICKGLDYKLINNNFIQTKIILFIASEIDQGLKYKVTRDILLNSQLEMVELLLEKGVLVFNSSEYFLSTKVNNDLLKLLIKFGAYKHNSRAVFMALYRKDIKNTKTLLENIQVEVNFDKSAITAVIERNIEFLENLSKLNYYFSNAMVENRNLKDINRFMMECLRDKMELFPKDKDLIWFIEIELSIRAELDKFLSQFLTDNLLPFNANFREKITYIKSQITLLTNKGRFPCEW